VPTKYKYAMVAAQNSCPIIAAAAGRVTAWWWRCVSYGFPDTGAIDGKCTARRAFFDSFTPRPPRGATSMAAPKISQLGGGIRKDQVGASTVAYEAYFDGHGGAGAEAGNAERTGNYADVVNKCVHCRSTVVASHAAPCAWEGGTRPCGSGHGPKKRTSPLTLLGPPGCFPPRYYDLATSFYEYGWVRVGPGALQRRGLRWES
jgi:hypothetical protein